MIPEPFMISRVADGALDWPGSTSVTCVGVYTAYMSLVNWPGSTSVTCVGVYTAHRSPDWLGYISVTCVGVYTTHRAFIYYPGVHADLQGCSFHSKFNVAMFSTFTNSEPWQSMHHYQGRWQPGQVLTLQQQTEYLIELTEDIHCYVTIQVVTIIPHHKVALWLKPKQRILTSDGIGWPVHGTISCTFWLVIFKINFKSVTSSRRVTSQWEVMTIQKERRLFHSNCSEIWLGLPVQLNL